MLSMPTRIRRARIGAKLSQTQLAALVGVQRSAVSQWENPKGTWPNIGHLAQVAITTDVCFEWLATGRGAAKPNGNEFDMGVTTRDFVQSDQEARVLELLRGLSPKRRQAACSMLELFLI